LKGEVEKLEIHMKQAKSQFNPLEMLVTVGVPTAVVALWAAQVGQPVGSSLTVQAVILMGILVPVVMRCALDPLFKVLGLAKDVVLVNVARATASGALGLMVAAYVMPGT
jgi:hypothetical protein